MCKDPGFGLKPALTAAAAADDDDQPRRTKRGSSKRQKDAGNVSVRFFFFICVFSYTTLLKLLLFALISQLLFIRVGLNLDSEYLILSDFALN